MNKVKIKAFQMDDGSTVLEFWRTAHPIAGDREDIPLKGFEGCTAKGFWAEDEAHELYFVTAITLVTETAKNLAKVLDNLYGVI